MVGKEKTQTTHEIEEEEEKKKRTKQIGISLWAT